MYVVCLANAGAQGRDLCDDHGLLRHGRSRDVRRADRDGALLRVQLRFAQPG